MNSKNIRLGVLFILGFSLILLLLMAGCSKTDGVKVEGERISVMGEDPVSAEEAATDGTIALRETEDVTVFPLKNHKTPNVKLDSGNFKNVYTKSIGSSGDFLTAQPIIMDGKIYTLNNAGEVRSYDIKTGEENGRIKLKGIIPLGAGLAPAKDALYVNGGAGRVFAVAKDLKRIVWKSRVRGPLRIPPGTDGKRVFTLSKTGEITALKAEDGKEIWKRNILFSESTPFFAAQMTVDKEQLLVGSSAGEVLGFQTATGEPLFAKKVVGTKAVFDSDASKALIANIVYDGKTILAASPKNLTVAMTPTGDEPLWAIDKGASATPIWVGNTVYLVTSDRKLMAVNARNGKVYFEKALSRNLVYIGAILTENTLVLVAESGRILFYDALTGNKKSEKELGAKVYIPPVAGSGTLFVLTNKGKLHAFR